MPVRLLAVVTATLLLSGCEIPGIYPDPKTVQREADAKATGGGCRHALRALEDCYTLNAKAPRAAIFAGWREMDQYMRENKIEGVQAVMPAAAPAVTEAHEESVASSRDKAAAEPRERRARGS